MPCAYACFTTVNVAQKWTASMTKHGSVVRYTWSTQATGALGTAYGLNFWKLAASPSLLRHRKPLTSYDYVQACKVHTHGRLCSLFTFWVVPCKYL